MQNYHRMYLVSQERYEKVQNLGSSGGAASIKDDSDSLDTPVFSDNDSSLAGYLSHRRVQSLPGASGAGAGAGAAARETDDETEATENGRLFSLTVPYFLEYNPGLELNPGDYGPWN